MSIRDLSFMSHHDRRNYIDRKLREKGLQKAQLTADGFMDIWTHYDKNGDLVIDAAEVDNFLDEYLTSAYAKFIEIMSEPEIRRIKQTYKQGLQVSDAGTISLAYMARLLPVEIGITALFQAENRTKTAVEFMEIWKRHDSDLSGSIDKNEFTMLLHEMLHKGLPTNQNVDMKKAEEYAEAFLPLFDSNCDGKLSITELARLLPSKENFVQEAIEKAASVDSLSKKDIEQLLKRYDCAHENGRLEGAELSAFIRDLFAATSSDYSAKDLDTCQKALLNACDLDKNGAIDAKELALIMKIISKAQRKGGDIIQNLCHVKKGNLRKG